MAESETSHPLRMVQSHNDRGRWAHLLLSLRGRVLFMGTVRDYIEGTGDE